MGDEGMAKVVGTEISDSRAEAYSLFELVDFRISPTGTASKRNRSGKGTDRIDRRWARRRTGGGKRMIDGRHTWSTGTRSIIRGEASPFRRPVARFVSWILVLLLAAPPLPFAQESEGEPVFMQEEIEQLVAPVALYPDDLLSQVLMASTYPLEVVQADRWVKKNEKLKGEALTAALEKETWDPSVKSLVNFPQVLTMMSEKLDWTQKLGDAFLAQQKEVMDAVQKLRAKAKAEGNLETTKEQKVTTQEKVIVIERADPEVVYVPVYNPTVVYGAWAYPAYPPYYYYPPGYVAGTAVFAFTAGVIIGSAWGYAWGGCNWRGGHVDIDINRNVNINANINRDRYRQDMREKGQIGKGGRGEWRHDAGHRKGVAYRDQGTARKFDRGTANDTARSREQFRGRTGKGGQEMSRRGADKAFAREGAGRHDGAFGGLDQGKAARAHAERGRASRGSMGASRGMRGGGGRRR